MRPLTGLAANAGTFAFGINDRGDVAGSEANTQNDTPVLWRHGGQPVSLAETCVGLGAPIGWVVDINDSRAVLSFSNEGPATQFFVPQLCQRNRITFLPPLGPSGNNFPVRMNNRGVVAGYADVATSSDIFAVHAVLWVPERSTDCD